MAEIKYRMPKAVAQCRQWRGRKKNITMAPASLNGPTPGMVEKEMDVEDSEWCKECSRRGERNALSFLQISNELAVLVCNNEMCTSLPTLAPGSQLVVERRAADIIHYRRRKRRAPSLPDPAANSQTQLCNQSQPQGSTLVTVTPLPQTGVLQWRNDSNLCWLDVCMFLLVQFQSLRRCHQALGSASPLKRLCDGFDAAQESAGDAIKAAKQIRHGQRKGINSPSGEQTTESLNVEELTAEIKNNPFGVGNNNDRDEKDLLSDNLLDFLTENNAQTVGDMVGRFVPIINPPSLPAGTKSSQQAPHLADTSTSKLAAALESLRSLREELFEMLKPKLGCKTNTEESPVSALPALLRLDGVTEEHFSLRYRREFYCFSCGFTNLTMHRSVVMSLTTVSPDFSMQNPTMHHPCPQCKAPEQVSRLIYHSLPSCPLVHFSNGLSDAKDSPWLQPEFKHGGHHYNLNCIIQYMQNPNHFVIWIRDPSREQWMKCDDLSSPVCLWQSQDPSIPPSEIHIVGWERQNINCSACLELQQQIVHIQEAAMEREDEPMLGTPCSALKTSVYSEAPLRKKSCPVLVGQSAASLTVKRSSYPLTDMRSSSPLTTSTSPSISKAARNMSDISRLSPQPRKSLPASSIFSIGTPPHSPEFQLAKTISTSDSKDSIHSNVSKIEDKSSEKRLKTSMEKRAEKERTDFTAESENPGHESNNRSVASYLLSKNKNSQKPGVLTRLLAKPRSVPKWKQETEEAKNGEGVFNPATKNFSLLQTLRYLNVNATLPRREFTEVVNTTTKPINRTGSKPNPRMEKAGLVTSSHPKKVQKVRVARPKISSFSAFKERSSSTFAGYLKQKDPAQENCCHIHEDSHPNNSAKQIHDDDFQSSILLTPSSSVSSPSACSDVSLQSENLIPSNPDEQELENLSNTMDALCQALDVADRSISQTITSNSLANCDDNFLKDLLR